MFRTLVRRLGIAAKRIAPPGTARYRALQRTSWLLPSSVRANYESDPVAETLHRFAGSGRAVFFVQVGSHEGRAGDPISLYVKRDGWSGVLVEPVPEIFARLERQYAGCPGLIFENVAIAESDGRRTFFRLAESAGELYELADSLGTLDREVLLSHADRVPDIEERIEEIEVPCLTFDSLLGRHAVERIDLLHIDAEGYDAKLLETFPWDRFHPDVVLWEHSHLGAGERAAADQRMIELGYRLERSRTNTVAILGGRLR